eukprot:5622_1
MDFNVNISPTELNKFYNINLTPNQTPQQQSKKTTTQYVDHEVVAALDCAQTKQCNTNHNDNQPHISIGNTLSIPHDTSGYRSILENELSTFNRGFEAQKKLLIQQQLLDSKVQKVKKKRHIEPSADINDFFKLLNKHDKVQLQGDVIKFNRDFVGSYSMTIVKYHESEYNLSQCIHYIAGNNCIFKSGSNRVVGNAYIHGCIAELYNSQMQCIQCAPRKWFSVTNTKINWHVDEQIVLKNRQTNKLVVAKLFRWKQNYFGYPDLTNLWTNFFRYT